MIGTDWLEISVSFKVKKIGNENRRLKIAYSDYWPMEKWNVEMRV